MPNTNRSALKQHFTTGAFPTEAHFADLIDSLVNKTDDQVTVSAGNIGLGDPDPQAKLTVQGAPPVSIGSGSAAAGSMLLRMAAAFAVPVKAGMLISFGKGVYRVAALTGDTQLELDAPVPGALSEKPVYLLPDLVKVAGGPGAKDAVFCLDGSGRAGIGTAAPQHTLEVAGSLSAESITAGPITGTAIAASEITAGTLAGDGAGLTNLQAAALRGKIDPELLPPASLNNTVTGLFTITQAYDRLLKGRVSGSADSDTLTGEKTAFKKELSENSRIQIGKEVVEVLRVVSDTELELKSPLAAAVTAAAAYAAGSLLRIADAGNRELAAVNGQGDLNTAGTISAAGFKTAGNLEAAALTASGAVTAAGFNGDGGGLTNIPAVALRGKIDPDLLPPANAHAVSGLFSITQAYDQALKGKVSGAAGSGSLTGNKTAFLKEIGENAKLRIGEEVYDVLRVESDTALSLQGALAADISGAVAYLPGSLLSIMDTAGRELAAMNGQGGLSTAGMVSAAGFSTAGEVSAAEIAASGTISAAEIASSGMVTAAGFATAGEVSAAEIAASGTISAAGFSTVGNVSAAEIGASGLVTAAGFATAGEVSAAEIAASGTISAAGFSTAGNVSAGEIGASGLVQAAGFRTRGHLKAGALMIAGPILGDNLDVSGSVSAGSIKASGNVSAAAFSTAGVVKAAEVSATGTMAAGGFSTPGTMTAAEIAASGLVTAGGFATAGNVAAAEINASGLIRAEGIAASGFVSAAGFSSAGKVVAAEIGASGPVTAGSFFTEGHVLAAGLAATGTVTAAGFSGDGAGLTNIQAAAITGQLPFPTDFKISAANITGVLSPDQIPALDAGKIGSGTLDAARLPALTDAQFPVLHDILARLAAIEAKLDNPEAGGTAWGATLPAVTWDFKNAVNEGKIGTAAGYVEEAFRGTLKAVLSQTGGGPAADFGRPFGMVLLTNYFSETTYPYIRALANRPVVLGSLSYMHLHNHNPGYPTSPQYQVQLQLDTGDGFKDVSGPITASPASHGTTALIPFNSLVVAPGEIKIRWVPRGFSRGSHSGTEWFCLSNVVLSLASPAQVFETILLRLEALEHKVGK